MDREQIAPDSTAERSQASRHGARNDNNGTSRVKAPHCNRYSLSKLEASMVTSPQSISSSLESAVLGQKKIQVDPRGSMDLQISISLARTSSQSGRQEKEQE